MASDRTIFKFNILQTKSVQLKMIEYERDNSTLYALLLVLFASFVYLGIVVVQSWVVEPRRLSALDALGQRQSVAETFAEIRSLNGELFIKTRTLRPVLDKNLDTKEIFRVAEAITAANNNLIIESYVREKEGNFVFTLVSASIVEVPKIVSTTQGIEGVENVFVRSINVSEDTRLTRTALALEINAISI